MNSLTFRFEPENEWQGELFATLSANGFAGQGKAWFSTDELRDFAKALTAYPLQADALPKIAGGFGADSDHLEQTHLAVALQPHNARGEIRVAVQLATEVWVRRPRLGMCGHRQLLGDLWRSGSVRPRVSGPAGRAVHPGDAAIVD
jgi:hypothetical protein